MAQYRPSFAAYTAGVQPTGTSRPWASATWVADADSGALEGKYIHKTSSVQWDYLKFDVVGTADGQFQVRGRFRIPTGGVGLAIVVRSAGAAANPNAIFFELSPSQVTVSDVNGGTYTARASANHSGGSSQPAGTWMWLLGETTSSGSSTTTVQAKAWIGEVYDEPAGWGAWPSITRAWPTASGGVGIFCYQTNRGECDSLQIGTAGSAAPGGPAIPTVTVSAIGSTQASVSGNTYSGFTGYTHAASRFRVRRTSDNTIYGPVLVSSASTGPQAITGLPSNTSGLVGEAQYKDSGGLWSAWGTSAAFETLGPPDAPTVEVSDIRRTSVFVTPSAYSHPDSVAQAVRRVRVKRVSTSAIVVPSASVALSGGFYVLGLPSGPEGAGGRPAVDPDLVVEVQDEDANGLTSTWGSSAEFQTLNLWESGEFVTHVDVLIERPEGEGTVMQSYRDFGGRNWIRSVRVNPASVDTPIGSASVTLLRQAGGDSLAPLVTGSALNQNGGDFAPALDLGREIEIAACILPVDGRVTLSAAAAASAVTLSVDAIATSLGADTLLHFGYSVGYAPVIARLSANATAGAVSLSVYALNGALPDNAVASISREPTAADWLAGFHWRGITDDPEWPKKTGDIVVPARDYSGRLADTQIRTQARYGSVASPADAFDVMQDFVDAHMGVGQYVLDDLTTGDRFAVTNYEPKDIKVWEGLLALALQGGGVSVRQVDGPTESKVSIIEPDRTATTADYAISAYTYIEVDTLSTAGKNLRNIVRGRCVDSETGEILVSQIPEEVDVPTDPLVDLYGPLFLEFDEDQASAVNSQAELDNMVAQAYADVSSPPFPLECDTKFAPFATVNDMVEWGDNDLLWDEPMISATSGLVISFDSPGVGRTKWQNSGAQRGHWKEWIRRGVDVAGIGKRPSIFALTLTHSPTGTLNADLDYNDQVEFWRPWDNIGASPVTSGTPVARYARGEYRRPVRLASWSVTNGEHHVYVRAYAGGRFVSTSATIAILGVGPGSGEVPITVPLTPRLVRGVVDGGNQSEVATWGNSNTVDAIELEYFIDGVTDPDGLVPLPAGAATDEREYVIGSRITMHARYTAGPGLAGDWSALSNAVFLTGSLP
jgi:hypothetical protein